MSTVETLLIKVAAHNLHELAGISAAGHPQMADVVVHYLEQQIAPAEPPQIAALREPGWRVTLQDLGEFERLRTSVMRGMGGRSFTDDSVVIIEEARNERTAEL